MDNTVSIAGKGRTGKRRYGAVRPRAYYVVTRFSAELSEPDNPASPPVGYLPVEGLGRHATEFEAAWAAKRYAAERGLALGREAERALAAGFPTAALAAAVPGPAGAASGPLPPARAAARAPFGQRAAGGLAS